MRSALSNRIAGAHLPAESLGNLPIASRSDNAKIRIA